jgi:hypothetical protein
MKILPYLITTFFLIAVLISCVSTPKPTEYQKTSATNISTQATLVVIPTDLAFSNPLVQALSQSGLSVISVQPSTFMAFFNSTNKAVWVKTYDGIVEAVFFTDPAEVKQIRIAEHYNESTRRYLYTIQAPPPTLLYDQTIDAEFPLYFTVKNDMLMITSSEELDKTLEQIFAKQ